MLMYGATSCDYPQTAAHLVAVQVIKKRIESLIDREFLERDATDRSVYRYLA